MARRTNRPKRQSSHDNLTAPAALKIAEAKEHLSEARKSAARAALLNELTLSVYQAAVLLGLSRNHAYDLVAEGAFPVPVVKAGRCIRVPTAALREVLQIEKAAA